MSRPILMLILNIIGARRLSSISIIAMVGIVPGWSRRLLPIAGAVRWWKRPKPLGLAAMYNAPFPARFGAAMKRALIINPCKLPGWINTTLP